MPEEHLRGAILVFDEAGVTRYLRGQRDGDQVTIEVSMSSYRSPQFTEFTCLGRRPLFDEWPVAVPPSQMRVFSAGSDVTNQVGSMWYFPAAQAQPVRNSLPSGGPVERYADNRSTPVTRTADGAVNVPANMGCKFFVQNTLADLTAEFVFDYPQKVTVEPLGSETFTFRSYVGPGFAGRIESLANQMKSNYPDRHDKFPLNPPTGTDFVWLNYPPSPVSAYASPTSTLDNNIRLPSSGTYRLIGEGDTKSVDHLVSMGLPLDAQWIDSGLSGGQWLERTNPIEVLSAPEYFVPPGVPYQSCMKDGGCDDTLLDEIYNASAEMTLHYYHVRRLRSSNLMRVPLRQVGPNWVASLWLGRGRTGARRRPRNTCGARDSHANSGHRLPSACYSVDAAGHVPG